MEPTVASFLLAHFFHITEHAPLLCALASTILLGNPDARSARHGDDSGLMDIDASAEMVACSWCVGGRERRRK